MKFKIDGKALKDAAAMVDAAVNPKSEVPDESHIFLMTTGQGTLFLIGRNDRFSVKVSNVVVTDDEAGTVLLHAPMWSKLVQVAAGRTVELESDDVTRATVRLFEGSEKPVKFNLNAMAADQYMPLAVGGSSISCKMDKLHVRDGLKLVRPTADSDNSLDVANGVCFEFDDGGLRLIATDMSTLGYAEVVADYNGSGAPATKQVRVLPREALDLVDSMIGATAESDVEVRFGDTLVSFASGNVEVTTKILAGGNQYIDWQRCVPDAIDGSSFTATVGAIVSAMRLAEVVNGGDPVSVDFEIAAGEVTVSSSGLSGTEAGSVAAGDVYGDSKFRLDSKLVKNALRALDGAVSLNIAPVNSGHQLQVTPTLPNLTNTAFQVWGTKTRKKEIE